MSNIVARAARPISLGSSDIWEQFTTIWISSEHRKKKIEVTKLYKIWYRNTGKEEKSRRL